MRRLSISQKKPTIFSQEAANNFLSIVHPSIFLLVHSEHFSLIGSTALCQTQPYLGTMSSAVQPWFIYRHWQFLLLKNFDSGCWKWRACVTHSQSPPIFLHPVKDSNNLTGSHQFQLTDSVLITKPPIRLAVIAALLPLAFSFFL